LTISHHKVFQRHICTRLYALVILQSSSPFGHKIRSVFARIHWQRVLDDKFSEYQLCHLPTDEVKSATHLYSII